MMDYAYSRRMEGVQGDAIREILALTSKTEVISFAGGMPSADAFPLDFIKEATQYYLENDPISVLQYGNTQGFDPLLTNLKTFLADKGIKAEKENFIITTGSQEGLELVCKTFINPSDVVLVESPTYLVALQTFKSYEAKCESVETDHQGVIPEDLEEKIKKFNPKLVYLIPNFQNPTGITLNEERRRKCYELANKYNVIILEDDPYGELRYYGEVVPSMKSMDTTGHVIYLQSFSKIVSPGLRVGAIVADKNIIAKINSAKQSVDVHTATLNQAIVSRFIETGEVKSHVKFIKDLYKKKMDCMIECLGNYLPEGSYFSKPDGGMFIWCELDEKINSIELLREAAAKNVAFIPGIPFYAEGGHANTFRLNFSSSSIEQMEKGLKILGDIISSK